MKYKYFLRFLYFIPWGGSNVFTNNERYCISLFEGKKTENNKESLLWNSKASNLLPFSKEKYTADQMTTY